MKYVMILVTGIIVYLYACQDKTAPQPGPGAEPKGKDSIYATQGGVSHNLGSVAVEEDCAIDTEKPPTTHSFSPSGSPFPTK